MFCLILKYFSSCFSLTSSRDFIIGQLPDIDCLLLPAGFRGPREWIVAGRILVWRGGKLGNSGNSRFRGFPDFRDFAAAHFFAFFAFSGFSGGGVFGWFSGRAS